MNFSKLKENTQVYALEEKNGKRHTLIYIQECLCTNYTENVEKTINENDDDDDDDDDDNNVYNIIMADTSESMNCDWKCICIGWNEYIADSLKGRKKFFTFSESVTENSFIDGKIKQRDFKGGLTNLTAALRKINTEICNCKEKNINVFLITDGHQNVSVDGNPEEEIEKMTTQRGKTVNVYLLGVGNEFPVNYSLSIRSRLHNGNSNVPSLFWAQKRYYFSYVLDERNIENSNIIRECKNIGDYIKKSKANFKLKCSGFTLPWSPENCTNILHPEEWIFIPRPPEDLSNILIEKGRKTIKIPTCSPKSLSITCLVNNVYRQWISNIIQNYRRNSNNTTNTSDLMSNLIKFMDDIFDCQISKMKQGKNIRSRMFIKKLKMIEEEYTKLKKDCQLIINPRVNEQEIELASRLLRSTVTQTKYDPKILKIKGHTDCDYVKDVECFKKLYEKNKDKILALPSLEAYACAINMNSTLQDLQDPDLIILLDENNKFEFLKTFSMTGIPILAPIRNSAQINPWTMVVKNILVSPYAILSQQVLEQSAEIDETNISDTNKDFIIQPQDEKTRFNIIVPIFPAHVTKTLIPIVLSNLYAMLTTFCVLKNPHIIDHNAHLAALGCTWIKTIKDCQQHGEKRPEFICARLQDIEATASIYRNRVKINKYMNILAGDKVREAIMTESIQETGVKCESLVKPMFLSHLLRNEMSHDKFENIFILLLREFIGRCLSSFGNDGKIATPFTHFFAPQLDKKGNLIEEVLQKLLVKFKLGYKNKELVEIFYSLDDLNHNIQNFLHETFSVKNLGKILATDVTNISLDMKKIHNLGNIGSCGNVNWSTLIVWAHEMGIPKDNITDAVNLNQVQRYVCHALLNRNSKDRLSKKLPSLEATLEEIKTRIIQENYYEIKHDVMTKLKDKINEEWKQKYMDIHLPVVKPMTKEEIINAASTRGVNVDSTNFETLYRYDEQLGILRNACQIEKCPFYLKPAHNFNQHLSVERERENYPHCLHKVTYDYSHESTETIIKELTSGNHTGTRKRRHPPPPNPDKIIEYYNGIRLLQHAYKRNKSN
uniref:VWFA domain-containing protein n=1 Tax=Metapenaeus ensis majanivirus TaxID=2984279 RepID=A0A9C7F6X8_9VIRU|nr:MAG: hypothetical protein [Metapenaeus ensis majanivirus]